MHEMKQIAQAIREADAILIGASNGLSITEGLHLFADNAAFDAIFGDMKRRYGMRCILQGMSAQWAAEEEKWSFWTRLIHHYCAAYKATPVMQDLREIVGRKDYFVITSNGECHFEMSGFARENILEIEGNWLTMQCARPCCEKLYPALEAVENMAAQMVDGKIPAALLPKCPKCGGAMDIQMGAGIRMIEDRAAKEALQEFLARYHGKKVVVLELGIGWRNQLIKAPLMGLVAREPHYTYVTINLGEVYIPEGIKAQSFGLDGKLSDMLAALRETMERV